MIDTKDMKLKIIDYGLSKYVQDGNFFSNERVGTPKYMPPELDQAKWQAVEIASRATQASDTPPGSDMRKGDSYACGVIICDLCADVPAP